MPEFTYNPDAAAEAAVNDLLPDALPDATQKAEQLVAGYVRAHCPDPGPLVEKLQRYVAWAKRVQGLLQGLRGWDDDDFVLTAGEADELDALAKGPGEPEKEKQNLGEQRCSFTDP